MVRYVDYTSKYGLGFLLNTGGAGVYFNDSTKIVISPNGLKFQYSERMRKEKGSSSSEHAIQTLHELKTKGRKIAVLGDMLELGEISPIRCRNASSSAFARLLGYQSRDLRFSGSPANFHKSLRQILPASSVATRDPRSISSDGTSVIALLQSPAAAPFVARFES